ncbi:MAG: rRNA (adenine-N6)-dimethyltransferase [Actinomycetota bacterium]|nr:rRNA (adenine-N6)-dimethyltransferase [Actinomycetota bacterium]
MLDVGAGWGAITEHLVAARAHTLAIELHPGRARSLEARFAGQDVRVVRADAADLWLPPRPFRVVANPPYAATTGLIRHLTAPGSRLTRADLLVTDWVAARWASGSGPMRRGRFETTLGRRVPARAFRPPAPRDARVLVIKRRGS